MCHQPHEVKKRQIHPSLSRTSGELLSSTSIISTELAPILLGEESSESEQLGGTKRESSRAVKFFNDLETDSYPVSRICGPCHIFVVWDSIYSLKILGSRNAIQKEEVRRLQLPHFIIHPCSRVRWVDIALLIFPLFYIYNLYVF